MTQSNWLKNITKPYYIIAKPNVKTLYSKDDTMNANLIACELSNKINSIHKKIVFNRIIFEGIKPSIEGIDRLENYYYMKEILDNNVARFIRITRDNDPLANNELDIIDISEDVIEDILVSYWWYVRAIDSTYCQNTWIHSI